MSYKKIALVLTSVGVLCVGVYYIVHASEITIDPEKLYEVAYVVDGDTFKAHVGRHEITVRMLGVNTPETVDRRKAVECYGHEASDMTKGLLTGRMIRLKQNPNREVTDKYGRFLVYVYRDDGLFINEELLKGGFAHEYTFGTRYDFQEEFRGLEKEARESKIGLWGKCETADANAKHR